MKKFQALKPFQIFDGRCLVALDGSEFHNSYKIQCPQCRTRLRSSGETEYHHIVLCATLVGTGHSDVLPLRPKFITPQDGDQKQDCETKAAYRWFDQNAARYASLRPIYLSDYLYANEPMCEKVTQADGNFIFRVKERSHNMRSLRRQGLCSRCTEHQVHGQSDTNWTRKTTTDGSDV